MDSKTKIFIGIVIVGLFVAGWWILKGATTTVNPIDCVPEKCSIYFYDKTSDNYTQSVYLYENTEFGSIKDRGRGAFGRSISYCSSGVKYYIGQNEIEPEQFEARLSGRNRTCNGCIVRVREVCF